MWQRARTPQQRCCPAYLLGTSKGLEGQAGLPCKPQSSFSSMSACCCCLPHTDHARTPGGSIARQNRGGGCSSQLMRCFSCVGRLQRVAGPPESWVVLGIESSCDDTAAAVIRGDGTVLAHKIASQVGGGHAKKKGPADARQARGYACKRAHAGMPSLHKEREGSLSHDYTCRHMSRLTQGKGRVGEESGRRRDRRG